jgi:hypothetical protein
MKGPDINITSVERAGRIATGATGAMMSMSSSDDGGDQR